MTQFDPETSQKTIKNAARAHSLGAEFQVEVVPVQGLSLEAGLGYTRARFDDFQAMIFNTATRSLVQKDYAGMALPMHLNLPIIWGDL